MKPETKLQYFDILYLHNKNILEYAEIVRSAPKSMILNIRGCSSKYILIIEFIFLFNR